MTNFAQNANQKIGANVYEITGAVDAPQEIDMETKPETSTDTASELIEPLGVKHICTPMEPYCTCDCMALEPDDNCQIHGYIKERPRCKCGKFCKIPPKAETPCEMFSGKW